MLFVFLIGFGSILDIIGVGFLFGLWVLVAAADIVIWLIAIFEAVYRSYKIHLNEKAYKNEFKEKNLFKKIIYIVILIIIIPINLTIHIFFTFGGIPALLRDTGGLKIFQ